MRAITHGAMTVLLAALVAGGGAVQAGPMRHPPRCTRLRRGIISHEQMIDLAPLLAAQLGVEVLPE
jgi:hypothetical protein